MSLVVNDYLIRNGARIGTNVTQKMLTQPTPWIGLYPKESWLEQESAVQKTFQFDRAQLLADEVSWANVSKVPDGNGALGDTWAYAIPPADDVIFTQTSRDFRLQAKALWGPRMSTNDLRDTFVRDKQMTAASKALADQARETWITRNRQEYLRLADKKVILDSNFETSMATSRFDTILFPDIASGGDLSTNNGSILQGGHLDYIYEYMNHQGAIEGCLGRVENRAVYALVTSARSSRRVITENGDKRADFHYSDRNAELLAPMGIKTQLNGWSHIIDDKVPRWHLYRTGASGCDSTAYITSFIKTSVCIVTLSAAIPTGKTLKVGSELIITAGDAAGSYIISAVHDQTHFEVVTEAGVIPSTQTTDSNDYFTLWIKVPQFAVIGGKTVPNPEWLAAGWEDSYVFHQNMCTSLVPSPITSVGGAQFDAVKYSGEYSWKNYPDETNNPDGLIGRFRGVLMSGTRPDNPEFGVVIRHRCAPGGFGAITDMSTLG